MLTKDFRDWLTVQSARLNRVFPSATPREEILARLAKLTEEVGELADEVLANSGNQRKEKLALKESHALSSEFADVVITSCLLAEQMGVDVADALTHKIVKINERFEKMEREK